MEKDSGPENEISQLLSVPTYEVAPSKTFSIQLPLGIIVPVPIPPKVDTVGVMRHWVLRTPLGLNKPVNGAMPALILMDAASVKMVLVKFCPLLPLAAARINISPPGDIRNIIRS